MRRADPVRYVEVVLDDEPAADQDSGAGSGAGSGAQGSGARRSAGRRRVAWVVATAVLATVLGVSAAGARAERRDARAVQRYADVPGVLASLRHPVQERWRLPPADGVWAVGDLVVTAEERAGVVARDALTGRTRWSAALPGGVTADAVRCPHIAEDRAGEPAAVVCLASPVTGAGAVRWGLGVLDASGGDAVQQATFPGVLLDSAVVDGDLVAAHVVDGGLTVSRLDLVRGREVWSSRVPDIAAGDPRLAIRATSEVVAVQGVMGVVLDARDGREIDGWRPVGRPIQGMSVRVLPRAGEGFGVWTSPFLGRWHRADGRPLAELRGYPADPPVLDGSTPGVVLLGSDDGRRLTAVDVVSGEERWQRAMPDRVLLRLGGRLVVADDATLEAVDMASGRRLWRVPLAGGDEPGLGPPFTDGLRVLVRGRDETGRQRLSAYALDTGERAWQASLAEDGQALTVLGDRLVSADRRGEEGPAGVLRFLG